MFLRNDGMFRVFMGHLATIDDLVYVQGGRIMDDLKIKICDMFGYFTITNRVTIGPKAGYIEFDCDETLKIRDLLELEDLGLTNIRVRAEDENGTLDVFFDIGG